MLPQLIEFPSKINHSSNHYHIESNQELNVNSNILSNIKLTQVLNVISNIELNQVSNVKFDQRSKMELNKYVYVDTSALPPALLALPP